VRIFRAEKRLTTKKNPVMMTANEEIKEQKVLKEQIENDEAEHSRRFGMKKTTDKDVEMGNV